VRSRIFLAVAAWLAGATVATGGSLFAVNMLGQGMSPAAVQQVSLEAVNQALASQNAEHAAAWPKRSGRPRHPAASSSPAARHPAPAPSPEATGGSVLMSQGGTLVAGCAGGRAYLVSWSPQPGFAANVSVRGPAARAQATFTSVQLSVTMAVSCKAGVPTASTTAGRPAGDDGE
jgi:hypothetical protein